jgi:hypothetical protein
MIDGVSILESGKEIEWDRFAGEGSVNTRTNWFPIAHFDVKSENGKCLRKTLHPRCLILNLCSSAR